MRKPRTLIGLTVLVVLVGFLGHRLWSRGTGLRLGAPASVLSGPHPTEAQWAAAQVIGDIGDMLLYARDAATKPGAAEVTVTRTDARLQAHVVFTGRAVDLDVDGREGVWSAATYAPIADRLMRELALRPEAPQTGAPDPTIVRFTGRLLEADAPALERESERLGAMLAAGMRRADLHEAAAFVVMGLALRESAAQLHDDRPQLLRMIAHLTLARTLRGGVPTTVPGAIAAAYADQLAGRGREAAQALEALAATTQDADAAWVRVLRTRIDDDWRRLPKPASHVERLEYFRAHLSTVATTPVFAELDRLDAADRAPGATPSANREDPDGESPSADDRDAQWGRIARRHFLRVDAAEVETTGFHDEIREIVAVWRTTHGGAAPADPVAALDGRRVGALTDHGPRPLSWGLWSRFFERHLVAYAIQIDRLYRQSYGDTASAVREGTALDASLGSLDLYPGATAFRLMGVANGDADLRLIDQAIRVTLRRPEIVPAHVWAWLEYGQQYEPVAQGMPSGTTWFARPVPRADSADLSGRLESIGHKLSADELDALWREMPSDFQVSKIAMERRFVQNRTADQVRALFGPRIDYDLRVRKHLGATLTEAADRVPIEEGNCRLDVEGCFALGWTLVEADREADAAAAYERALGDPRVGQLAMSNNVSWLTNYYRQHGKVERALVLANEAAAVGSARGIYARAWLYECLDRLDEAEEDYVRLAERYGDTYYPIGFYYRMARVRKLARYEANLQAALPSLFPSGLQPIGPNDGRQAPPRAVQVMKDSPLSRKYGIRAGDLIVGFDGWRVENLNQYYAIRGFANSDEMRLVLWRGARVDAQATAKGRWLSTELRSFPVHGWAE